MPWKDANIMELRIQFITDWLRKTHTVSDLCALYGISRKSGHKWIDRYQHEGGGRQQHREGIELQQDDEAGEAKGGEEHFCLKDADLPRGNGPRRGARDADIVVLVDDVVIRASRPAHDEGADEEEREMPGIGIGPTERELAQRLPPPAREEQQPGADRPVKHDN